MNPLRNITVTSPFGERIHPIDGTLSFHSGVDLRANYEDAYAIAFGTVERVELHSKGLGKYVTINHGSYLALYGHLSEVIVVEGQIVSEGEVIAVTGNTGQSTAPHLHFEIREPVPEYIWNKNKDGSYENATDPIEFIKENEHWAEKYFDYLNNNDVEVIERRFDDNITRGEVFALLARMKGCKE